MYSTRAGLILGFHGCDKEIADKIISSGVDLRSSENSYDWLGHGIYFWDYSPTRAFAFAKESSKRQNSKIKTPAVLGAVLNLGYCLNLLDYENMSLLKTAHSYLKEYHISAGRELPENSNIGNSADLLLRKLDCAVIETLHLLNEEANKQPFDSVIGAFVEGESPYDNAGFKDKNHIQICIRNPNCVKGYFRPKALNASHARV